MVWIVSNVVPALTNVLQRQLAQSIRATKKIEAGKKAAAAAAAAKAKAEAEAKAKAEAENK